jgi:nitrogen regulatory protein PII-like uncharacterized protein
MEKIKKKLWRNLKKFVEKFKKCGEIKKIVEKIKKTRILISTIFSENFVEKIKKNCGEIKKILWKN